MRAARFRVGVQVTHRFMPERGVLRIRAIIPDEKWGGGAKVLFYGHSAAQMTTAISQLRPLTPKERGKR